VHNVPFSTLAIEGYGDARVADLRIYIQSGEGESEDVWYQLDSPSPEYTRFYTSFMWLAHFTKHFVDYLTGVEHVSLRNFHSHFAKWLRQRYSGDRDFQSWITEAKLSDFRTTVAAHVGFLWKECYALDDGHNGLCEHPVWGEVDSTRLKAIPAHPSVVEETVVTPFAYLCFQNMYFAKHMKELCIAATVQDQVSRRKESFELTPLHCSPGAKPRDQHFPKLDHTIRRIQQGDVVCVQPDTATPWKSKATAWFAYVQQKREHVLDVLWLYEPGDTTLGSAYYPFQNELFLSDNCSCGNDAVHVDAVLYTVDVDWFQTDPSKAKGFFVRQKYRTVQDDDTYDFLSLKDSGSDFQCSCSNHVSIYQECRAKYSTKDTVLVRKWNRELGEHRLEPAQILHFDGDGQRVLLRLFSRKADFDLAARPNELMLTDVTVDLTASRVVRRCHVRYLDPTDIRRGRVPAPYDRDGAGDLFYMAHPAPYGNPTAPLTKPKLRGMGIFCGGGNLDYGLEEGGAVEFAHAIDWSQTALHTYRANVSDPDAVKFWLGSVNDYLVEAIAGKVARPGDINLLSAGSPCPGFSSLQQNKGSPQSLRNASMVASVVSYVDLYSPEYCIMENVVSMTYGLGANKDENVFGQILAAFVALGYQVQQFHMDAWSFGSPQQRSRVFIIASAPGLQPLPPPQHTHAHPTDMRYCQKSLGRSSNGLPFGVRRDDVTPFGHVSVRDAISDLPNIADSQPQLCPSHPDHRLPAPLSNLPKTRIAVVPTLPHGMGIVPAYRAGLNRVTGEPARYCERLTAVRTREASTTYSRVYPDGLFPTVLTALRIQDGIGGRGLHYAQHRPLTVLELRRAQGFQDHEVIIGTPAEQVVTIGNSVDRKVSFALGLCLRESWEHSVDVDVEVDVDVDVKSTLHRRSTRTAEASWVQQSREGTTRLIDTQIEGIE